MQDCKKMCHNPGKQCSQPIRIVIKFSNSLKVPEIAYIYHDVLKNSLIVDLEKYLWGSENLIRSLKGELKIKCVICA